MAVLSAPYYALQIIQANTDTTIQLPSYQPEPQIGQQYLVVDNLGTAGTTNITVKGNIAGNASGSATISSNYGSLIYTWIGSTYVNNG